MKIQLLESLGNYGVILDWKKFLPEIISIEIEREGVLTIGPKSYPVINGKVQLLEYQILPGPNKVTFIDKSGITYECGCIHKNTRFINIENPVDKLAVQLALTCEELYKQVKELKAEVKTIREQYGITII